MCRPGAAALDHGADIAAVQVNKQQVTAQRHLTVEAEDGQPPAIGRERLDHVGAALEDDATLTACEVEDMDVEIDAVAPCGCERHAPPVPADGPEVVLHTGFDHQLAEPSIAKVEPPQLEVLVATLVHGHNGVIRPSDIASRRYRLVEERHLGQLAAGNRQAIDLHAARVVQSDEHLGRVGRDVGDDRAARLQQPDQQLIHGATSSHSGPRRPNGRRRVSLSESFERCEWLARP